MIKGIDAIKKIEKELSEFYGTDIAYYPDTFELFYIIKHELHALETVKRYVGVQEEFDDIFKYGVVDKQFCSSGSNLIMTKRDYEILKEVLKD